jgi:hypothetical protein
MPTHDSDTTLYSRFFARCAVLIGVPSLAWAGYICYFYPVDIRSAIIRLSIGLTLTIGGLIVLLLTASSNPNQVRQKNRYQFIGSRVDGLMLFCSIPAILISLFFLPSVIQAYRMALLTDQKLVPVSVRINSIDIRQVSQDQFATESFYPIYNEVFYVAYKISDLWVAYGEVTLLEKNGLPIEPAIARAIFTFPTINRQAAGGSNPQSASYNFIEHHKMDAMMDSEHFEIGKTYPGWLLRDQTADVFFTRPSDSRLKDLIIVVSLLLTLCLYLALRIWIGTKLQDQHWVELRKIWSNQKT